MTKLRTLAAAALAAAAGGGVCSAAPRVDVLESDSIRIRARVTPSAEDVRDALSPDGAPTTGFLIAVPPEAEPVLTARAVRSSRIPEGRLGPERLALLAETPARLAERAWAAGTHLARVEVAPVTRGADGALLHETIEVNVEWRRAARVAAGGSAEGARRRAPASLDERTEHAEVPRLPRGGERDPVLDAVLATVVNAEAARGWRSEPPAVRAADDGPSEPGSCAACLKVEVVADGLYQVRYEDLSGYPEYASGDPRQFHLWHRGSEVPVEVDGEEDGVFGPGDRIVFLGLGNPGRYTDTNVYWLLPPDGARGLRVERRPAIAPGEEDLPAVAVVRGTVRLEEQVQYFVKMPAAEGKDPWMAAYLVSNDGAGAFAFLPSAAAGFDLPDLTRAVPGESYRLRARVVGRVSAVSDDEQVVDFQVNGASAGRATWQASAELDKAVDLAFDPSRLGPTGNVVRVDQPPPADPALWRSNFLDWVELDYPRLLTARGGRIDFEDEPGAGALYHVGGFARHDVRIWSVEDSVPARLVGPRVLSLGPGMPLTLVLAGRSATGAPIRILAAEPDALALPARIVLDEPSSLRSSPGAPWVAIAHPRFVAEARPLASARGGIVVDVTDVYDEFSDGIEDASAVRDFIAHAVQFWPVRPRYVALVGDASYDYRNHLGLAGPDFDPPSLVHTRDVYLESALDLRAGSDAWFAAAVGGDFVPDVALARIPARAPGEVLAYVSKLLAYEGEAPAPWMSRLELWADDDIKNDISECNVPGTVAADFDAMLSAYLPGADPGNIIRRYAGTYTMAFAPQVLRDDIVADLTAGVGLQVYAGHGNVASLGRHCWDASFPILAPDTLDLIANGPRLALGVAMTCDAADVDFVGTLGGVPTTRSIAETYLLAPDRGMAGWIATSTVLVYSTGARLTDALFSTLFAGAPVPPPENRVLGSVGLGVALRHFAERGDAARDAVLTLMLLGDPAARLNLGTP